MEKVRVIVTFEMKEEAIPGFQERVMKSTPLTLAEKGCISAGMYQDMQSPTHFRCIEDWESYEDLMNHLTKEKEPNPDDVNPYIMENMVGKDTFHYYREICLMTKEENKNL